MPEPITNEWIEEQLKICNETKAHFTWARLSGDFLAAAWNSYPAVLKELQRLRQIIYRAHAFLMSGEAKDAIIVLDEDRKPGTESWYD